MSSIVAYLIQ